LIVPFNPSTALRVGGGEDGARTPKTQPQAHDPPADAGCFEPAAKSRVVVHLQSIGQAQSTPCTKRVALDTLQTLIDADCLMQRPSLQVERVKGKDLATASEELRRPIHRVQDIIRRGARLRKINFQR